MPPGLDQTCHWLAVRSHSLGIDTDQGDRAITGDTMPKYMSDTYYKHICFGNIIVN